MHNTLGFVEIIFLMEIECRTQLPSIFPWTATPEKRRVIEKHEVPSTTKKIWKGLEVCELCIEDVFAEEIENNVSDNQVPVSEEINFVVCIDQACHTDDFRDLEDLKAKIETLNKEIEALNKENEVLKKNIRETNLKPKFDIEDYKSSDEDISFYTGFPNYDTLILCFDLLKEKAKNLCYSDKGTTHFDPSYNKPGWKQTKVVCIARVHPLDSRWLLLSLLRDIPREGL